MNLRRRLERLRRPQSRAEVWRQAAGHGPYSCPAYPGVVIDRQALGRRPTPAGVRRIVVERYDRDAPVPALPS